jgi:SAM-dependent methyltransferase
MHNAAMPGPKTDEQRLAFGRVADLYETARPSYPDPTIDQLIELAGLQPGAQVVEVGAGTGKATRMLAERGLALDSASDALRPSGRGSLARRHVGFDLDLPPLVDNAASRGVALRIQQHRTHAHP